MEPLEKKINHLSEPLQKKVSDYIDFLLIQDTIPKRKNKINLDWVGCLKEYKDKYTALELQKKAWEWTD